jgi:hypothetical protein
MKTFCFIDGCNRNIHAKNLCQLHYNRSIRGKDLSQPIIRQRKNGETAIRNNIGEKLCIGCNVWYNESYFKKHHSTADKLDIRCKECETFMRLQRMYKIGKQEVINFIEKQNGCAICHYRNSLFPIWWSVDHDHSCCNGDTSCGKCVRGIVCSFCNRGLGQF